MNERCWVLTGAYERSGGTWLLRREPASMSTGSSSSVDADWRWALAREERDGDVAGFWHTHPPGAGTAPSSRDVQTMRAWCSAFGKPLLCIIADGRRRAAYRFEDDESSGSRAGPTAWTAPDTVRVGTRVRPDHRASETAGRKAVG
jgi:hypothetical protein